MDVEAGTNDLLRSRVLVIDDAPEVFRVLKSRFRNEDLAFEHATTTTEGLAKARAICPDLILLDIDLPDGSGLDLLRALKDDDVTRTIPVLIISSHQTPEHKVAAFDLGAADYVAKPFEMIELRLRMRSALKVSHLLKLLSERAHIDGLTGLWNRHLFDRRWAEEHARAARYGNALSLLMLDLDYFKLVNDNHGHPVGDTVLRDVARVLRAQCRNTDIPCRYGGEEFAAILPETDPASAMVLAERLRAAVEVLTWNSVPDLRVTVSIGIAGGRCAKELGTLLWVEAADKCLYEAKHAGRNRVRMLQLTPPNAEEKTEPPKDLNDLDVDPESWKRAG